MQPAIRVENLSKRYQLGLTHAGSVRELVNSAVAKVLGREERFIVQPAAASDPDADHIWALRDVSFEVNPGEAIGIIGGNGAGKSTLLKLLSRITRPTGGRIELRGRVASLLEVGTGFHPELTGRENVYMNGSILGMSKRDIERQFDSIVDFAGVQKFVDTPVKRYSSGMIVRLGFAVAAHLEPEILIVDEVLAVGDLEFQAKCMGKMHDVAREGRTVLFVSHNMQAISRLTSRCVVLANGRVAHDGATPEAVSYYTNLQTHSASRLPSYVNESKKNGIRSARVITSDGNGRHNFGEELEVEFEFNLEEPSEGLCFSFQIVDEASRPVSHYWLLNEEQPLRHQSGKLKLICRITNPRLYMGEYTLSTHLTDRRSNQVIERLDEICLFELSMGSVSRDEYQWNRSDAVFLDRFEWLWSKEDSETSESILIWDPDNVETHKNQQ
jgi:lipopolysaccharide transport system ATP-binding protein